MVGFIVITVVFNAENTIRKTIESVLKQTHLPDQYLIIDGKSSDNTVDIASEYTQRFEELGVDYSIYSEKDTGLYNAMNKGISKAKDGFVSFLNAGDWYEEDALEYVYECYQKEPFDMAYGSILYIKQDGSVTIKRSKRDRIIISSRNWNHPSMFLKADYYRKYMFDEAFRFYSDFDLYLKLRRDKVKIKILDKVITNFVADGISTDTHLKTVKARADEKYRAYLQNGYSKLFCIEAYGWEFFKYLYFRLHKRK